MIKGYSCKEKGSALELIEYDLPEVGPNDVYVNILHCGICRSDISLIDNEWNLTTYPFVPGHEIIGEVAEKGSNVKHLAVGDRVGIGWQKGCCFTCENCSQGADNFCKEIEMTCVNHNGGFSEAIVVDSHYTFKLPDNFSSPDVAPILCGGITVYEAMTQHGVQPGMRVGVVGVGGLGHLAIKFLKAFGCETIAIGHKDKSPNEISELGVHHYVNSAHSNDMAPFCSYLDFILITATQEVDYSLLNTLLKPKGTVCVVGLPDSNKFEFEAIPFIMGGKKFVSSKIGPRERIKELLHFTSLHDIRATVEIYPFSKVNEAIDRLRSGKAHYRVVLSRSNYNPSGY